MIPCNKLAINELYRQHYDQKGGGIDIPVFVGTKFQKGYGLGGILGSLFKSALPVIKQGALNLAKSAVKTGLNIANDSFNGVPVKEAFINNARASSMNLANKAVSKLRQTVKRKSTQYHREHHDKNKRSKRKRVIQKVKPNPKTSKTRDIFSRK